MSVLKLEHVRTAYGTSQVLFDVSMQLETGQMISLLGRNGMGKTTTLKTIVGQLQTNGGEITLFGQSTASLAPHQIAQLGVGLVPEGRQIFPNLSTRENLIATANNRFDHRNPWTLDSVLSLFPALVPKLGLMGNLLSGGEQQMLAIGRALMTNPKLLLLDDATEGLAPQVRQEIWQCLKVLKDQKIAMVVIDKHVNDLLPMVDMHYVMEKGVIVWQGTSADWLADEQAHARFLGV